MGHSEKFLVSQLFPAGLFTVFSVYYIHIETFIILVQGSGKSSFADCDWKNDFRPTNDVHV